MKYKIGQILVILSLSLLFLAYSNFAPTALQNENIVGYVKNHFEIGHSINNTSSSKRKRKLSTK